MEEVSLRASEPLTLRPRCERVTCSLPLPSIPGSDEADLGFIGTSEHLMFFSLSLEP